MLISWSRQALMTYWTGSNTRWHPATIPVGTQHNPAKIKNSFSENRLACNLRISALAASVSASEYLSSFSRRRASALAASASSCASFAICTSRFACRIASPSDSASCAWAITATSPINES